MQIGDLVTRDSFNAYHYKIFGIIIDIGKGQGAWGTEESVSYKIHWNDETMRPLQQNQWWHPQFLVVV